MTSQHSASGAEPDGGEPDAEDLRRSAAGRVALVLLAFGDEPGSAELSGSAIARKVGRERSQVSRMLKVLASAGLVEQNPETRAYRLGWRMHHLAHRAGDHRLLAAAAPALRDLVARTKETALLSVLYSNKSFTVARERSTQSLQAGGWVGRTSPLHASASGRALILNLPDDQTANLVRGDLGARGLGPKAPKTMRQLRNLLTTERARGYTVAVDQLEDGLTSVGAPVVDINGRTVASINVSGPTSRFAEHTTDVATLLIHIANQISTRMHEPPQDARTLPSHGA